MARRDQMTGRRLLACLALAPPLAEVGHLGAYGLRYGAGAMSIQSSGVHAYFPALAGSSLTVLALAVVGSMLVVAAARLLAGRALQLELRRRPFSSQLWLTLISFQMAIYLAQETLEVIAAGQSPDGLFLAQALGFGLLGQGTVAALAALLIAFLGGRFECATWAIRTQLRELVPARTLPLERVPVAPAPRSLTSSLLAPSAPRRGPPAPF